MGSKCFVITGASSGLGKAMKDYLIAETLHEVVSLSRKPEPADALNDRIRYFHCDLASLEDFGLVDQVYLSYQQEELVFINNAASILPLEAVGRFNEENLKAYYKINVISPTQLMNKFISVFQKTKMTIVNISSGVAKRAIGHWSLYCSAKAAIHMFCDVLSIDHPEITVMNIDPGVIDTNMQGQIRDSDVPDLAVFSELAENGQLKKPIEVAWEILAPLI